MNDYFLSMKKNSPVSHVSRCLVSQSNILRALGQHNLQVLRLSLDGVHEVVQVAGGGLGGVGEVSLLRGDQQAGRHQSVAQDKLAGGNINLRVNIGEKYFQSVLSSP